MKKHDSIPYPSDEDIQKQITIILEKGLRKRKSVFSVIQVLFYQVGWKHMLPNRNEWLFSSIAIVSLLLISFSLGKYTVSPAGLAMLFMLSPFLFASLSLYSFYHKREAQTFELEMTTKYTVFQLIGIRMLVFSSLAILLNTSLTLWLSYMYEFAFIHLWLLSLTGLFLFAAGLLLIMRSGQLIPRIIGYVIGWVILNSVLLMLVETAYVQVILTLPTVVYEIIVVLLIGVYCMAFKRMFLRKQEGVLLC